MNKLLICYIKAAKELKLPIEYREEFAGVAVKLANKTYFFRNNGYTPFNAGSSDNIASNKYSVNYILRKANFPVPQATAISIQNRKQNIWSLPQLTYPIVAKPTTGTSCGLDVFCNIENEQILVEYLNKNAEKYQFISLESFEGGLTSYRVLVFFNKVIAVTQRNPACVIGNGKNTIAELIKIENAKRKKITNVTLGDLTIDKEYQVKLQEMNLKLDYVPINNEKIILCYTCNASRGGTRISMGKAICPENARLACDAAKALSLNFVGFDIICEDIMRPIQKSRGFIIEANSNPDIIIHESALAGINVPIAKILLKQLIKKHPIAYVLNYFLTLSNKLTLQQ